MSQKIFTHKPITVPKLKQVNLPGLRYYKSDNSDTKFVSITTLISHNTKHKFSEWREKVGEQEANRVTGRSTKRGTKTHSLIEAYMGNKPIPLIEEVFSPDKDYKIEALLNPYDRICAKKNKVVIDVYKDTQNPLKVIISANRKDSEEVLDLIHNEFGKIVFEPGTDPDKYNKTLLINASYYEFVTFCLDNLENANYYKETVDTFKNLPYTLFENIKPELDKIDNILGIEISLFSEYFGVAGTSDCIAEYNGVLSIIDYKTSDYIKKKEWIFDYFVQAVAYRYMLKELTGMDAEQLVIFMMAENGEVKPFVETNFTPYTQRLIQYIDKYRNDKEQEIAA